MRRWNSVGRGGPNPYPFCRRNPLIPSRRAMAAYSSGRSYNSMADEVQYLKDAAEYLKNQLDEVNKRIKEIEKED